MVAREARPVTTRLVIRHARRRAPIASHFTEKRVDVSAGRAIKTRMIEPPWILLSGIKWSEDRWRIQKQELSPRNQENVAVSYADSVPAGNLL